MRVRCNSLPLPAKPMQSQLGDGRIGSLTTSCIANDDLPGTRHKRSMINRCDLRKGPVTVTIHRLTPTR